MNFWENVSAILERKNISLRALAREIELTPAAVTKYAHGTTPGLDVAARIARYLNVSLDALVWGDGHTAPQALCPAPDDHAVLRELIAEFGLAETLLLSRLATHTTAWDIADALAERFPRFLAEEELAALVSVNQEHIRASLIALRKRRLVREQTLDGVTSYQLSEGVARFSDKGIGEISANAKRAVQMLFKDVVPRLETQDPRAHLTTVAAMIPEEVAEKMAREVYEFVVQKSELYTRVEGKIPVHMVFAVAVGDE